MDFVDGNHFDKYRSSNPVHRYLMRGFLRSIQELFDVASPESVLEVGCGPGDLAGELRQRVSSWPRYHGTDLSARQIEMAKQNFPELQFTQTDACQLPFADDSFELVMGCEVLEHIDQPELAVAEMARVSSRWILVSVPWEPSWRILNCLRGKYLRDFGNTPGHVGHFSRRSIRRLIETVGQVKQQAKPFPWTALLAELDKQPQINDKD